MIGDYKMWDVEAAEAALEKVGEEVAEAREARLGGEGDRTRAAAPDGPSPESAGGKHVDDKPDSGGPEGRDASCVAEKAGSTMPADLIDRAAKGLARGVWTSPFGGRLTPAEIARIVLIEVEPLLVEHGRQQRWPREALDAAEARGAAVEAARWKARIEKRIEDRERARDTYRPGTRIHAELNDRVILLRSLLTEGKEA